MKHFSTLRFAVLAGLLSLLMLRPGAAGAQVPPWVLAKAAPLLSGAPRSAITGMAQDASGNVFVTGYYTGQVAFGPTTLTSRGLDDVFVAKYVPATDTWTWAISAGGLDQDRATGIALSGSSIYLTGVLNNDRANDNQVRVPTSSNGTGFVTQLGVGIAVGADLLVAKYQDNGSTATLAWVQVAGGTSFDYGGAIAVSGNQVYVTGYVSNSSANATQVVFGSSGQAVGTTGQVGASATTSPDLVLAKYLDNGTSASVAWTQVAGGMLADAGLGLAVSGSSIYVTGYLHNDRANSEAVVFGGTGTTAGTQAQAGASASASYDTFVAKYLDQGSSATVAWTQVAGGSGDDMGQALTVSGGGVYVTGSLTNNRANTAAVLFGGAGLVAGSQPQYGASSTNGLDAFVAKYQDAGASASVAWTQVAGGSSDDMGQSLNVIGGNVCVAMALTNDLANSQAVVLGGGGPAAGTVARPGVSTTVSRDVVLARYTDQGTTAAVGWTQAGGGPATDTPMATLVLNSRLYVGGLVATPATFGPYSLPAATNSSYVLYFLATVDLTGTLATASAAAALPLTLYPNPTSAAAHLSGAIPHTAGQVLDALGRLVATFTTDVNGTAQLATGLAPGVYVVRVGQLAARLAVQ